MKASRFIFPLVLVSTLSSAFQSLSYSTRQPPTHNPLIDNLKKIHIDPFPLYTTMTDDINNDSSPELLLVSLRDKLTTDNADAKFRLVLASQSPRRREILDMMGLAGRYSTSIPPLNESSLQIELRKQSLHPREYTRRLAEAKAKSVAEEHASSSNNNNNNNKGSTVFFLGSDTVVDIDDRILEKPNDTKEAKAMVTRLSGKQVISYVCVCVCILYVLGQINVCYHQGKSHRYQVFSNLFSLLLFFFFS